MIASAITSPPRPPAISVRGVSHRFGTSEVLKDVSFELAERGILGVVGPNGAGKTTTLRVLATLLEPDVGDVTVAGVDILADPFAARRVIGFMPDGFGVYEQLSVLEYLDFFAGAHRLFGAARRTAVESALALTQMGELRDEKVGVLSKGVRQRLAIARTLLHDPEVLILDEPANGLDPRARADMRDLIRELERLGKTIVISSHILSELAEMCTDVLIIESGTVRARGPIAEMTRGLRREQRVRIELLEPLELGASEGLSALFSGWDPAIEGAEVTGGKTIVLRHRGEDAVIARVVSELVARGARITRVEPEASDLSRIFFEVTKGEIR